MLEIIHKYIKFLSTPSARRATRRAAPTSTTIFYFYPRPPRGGRRKALGIGANVY